MPQTRVHAWRALGPHSPAIFLKREDEGRFAVTAGKLRKYASVLPWLLRDGVTEATVIGSANSNNVVAACILLIENGIRPIPILKQGSTQGTNQLFLQLLVDPATWQQVAASDWENVLDISAAYRTQRLAQGIRCSEIVEGACQAAALPGAMTLAADIQRNQVTLGVAFSDIFIDAGTGMAAVALAMGMADLGMQACIHVTLMADSEEVFWEKADGFDAWYQAVHGRPSPAWRTSMILRKPIFGAAFGSVNAQVLDAIGAYARLGLLTDPIYSAKHLATAEQVIAAAGSGMGNVLIIHSGGAQSLPGFAHKLPGR